RKLDAARAVDGHHHYGDRAADEQGRLEPAAAPREERGARGRGDEPDRPHAAASPGPARSGSATIGRGRRPASATAAPRAASTRAKSPTTVGPEPHTSARSAPAPRRASSASPIAGHRARAAG